MAHRIRRLVFLAGGVVLPPLAEAAASFLAAGRKLSPAQRLGLQEAAHALTAGLDQPEYFCVRAAEICGSQVAAAPVLLHEHLAEGLTAQPGMPVLIAELAQTLEVRLVSDYPSVWLLPALARGDLARCFPATEITYVADLGGFSGLFDALVTRRAIAPGQSIWVDAHSPRTSEALRRGVDAAIFVDARRLCRDLGLWGLAPFPA